MTESQSMTEPRWPSALAVVLSAVLYLTLPSSLVVGPVWVRYVVPGLALAVLVPLLITAPHRHAAESQMRRRAAMTLAALISIGNALALFFLVRQLLYGTGVTGRTLLYSAFNLWSTNVIVFALWYWELDGGGPPHRMSGEVDPRDRDFAFVQETDPEVARPGWYPRFVDYLYLAYTNASAFSPTDTMPLTARAKLAMLVQSTISILTLLLVAARAVNILR
jgi:uncharacterized membrane protein